MKLKMADVGWALAMLAMGVATGGAPAIAQDSVTAAEQTAAAPFVPADFEVPIAAEGPGFKLVPLGPELVKLDYDAYMSSIEHLQQTFTRNTAWPHVGLTDADAMLDMETEQARFGKRESFAYGVLTPDGTRERGSFYVRSSPVADYDAVVMLWVTKADYDAGFDTELYRWGQEWVAKQWPFAKVAYPGRAIDWATWDALTAE